MGIDYLAEEDLSSILGGKWFYINGHWLWIDTLDYDPEEDMYK